MTPTSKRKKSTTRCLLDITDTPPSAFALPDDGRKATHLQMERKAVASQIARYANADGTQAYPSVATMMKATGRSRATIFRILKDLRTLGVLRDGDIHEFHKTRVRTLDVQRLRPVSDSPHDPSQIHGSPVSGSQAPVSD